MQIWEFSDNWEYCVIRGMTGLAKALVPDVSEKHYKPFADGHSTDTTVEHMLLLKIVRNKGHQICFNPLL